MEISTQSIAIATATAKDVKDETIVVAVKHDKITCIPVGVAVRVDCNPISRYNHAIKQYSEPCNQIEGISLVQICCPCAVSWLYDCIIFFYTYFFLTITCQTSATRGWFYSLLILAIYVCLLIMPIISLLTLAITAIYFLYYVAGLIVYCHNLKLLGAH